MKETRGFTVIELIVAIVFLGIAGWFIFAQKHEVEQAARDSNRTIAVNAIYYNLENVYWEKNKYYPEELQPKDLPGMDPNLFIDPLGESWDAEGSSYHYEPTNCSEGKCKSYTLTAELEAQADFVKKSNHN